MRRSTTPSVCFTILSAFAAVAATVAQEIRLGGEFQVNSYTVDSQWAPAIAADAEGDFVVAWQAYDGFARGVFAQRFSSAGVRLASEFQVNVYTTSNQQLPVVATDEEGDFVIAWASESQDGSGYGIFARRFTSAGVGLGGEFQLNAYTSGYQGRPSMTADADGDFTVTWGTYGQDGSGHGIFARRFSSAGLALTAELLVNSYTFSFQRFASVASDIDGDFVVTWGSVHDGSGYGVFAQRFSSAGVLLGGEFQVNTYTHLDQGSYPSYAERGFPAVATDDDGDFVVAWGSGSQDGSYFFNVFAQRFSSAGLPLGGEFQVNDFTLYDQFAVTLARDADGDFVIAWQNDPIAPVGIFGRRFSSAGVALASEFQINSYSTNVQSAPAVMMSSSGNFVVVWESNLDGWGSAVSGQRFAWPKTLDVDADGTVGPLTDGILIVRFLFGFTGSTLTTNAVAGGCTRCDSGAIESHLAGLGSALDVDGDASVGALTDGLLGLRFLFDFTGTTLTTGAVGASCTRCEAEEIATYLADLLD